MFLHSFHSQVPDTVSNLDRWFDLIVSLDSHLDDNIPPSSLADAYPEKVRLAALRSAAHTQLRMCTGGLPALRKDDAIVADMLLVVPRRSVLSSIAQLNDSLEAAKVLGKTRHYHRMSIVEYERFLNLNLGLETYYSPPNDLMKLVDRVRRDESLLDIDIDYMSDMQAECYSPLKNVSPAQLNWSDKVLRFVRKTKPEVITLCEAKVSAIRNPESAFSRFLQRLDSLGYHVEGENLFENDEDAQRSLDLFQECFEKIVKKYRFEGISNSESGKNDDKSAYLDEEIREVREFFRARGMAS